MSNDLFPPLPRPIPAPADRPWGWVGHPRGGGSRRTLPEHVDVAILAPEMVGEDPAIAAQVSRRMSRADEAENSVSVVVPVVSSFGVLCSLWWLYRLLPTVDRKGGVVWLALAFSAVCVLLALRGLRVRERRLRSEAAALLPKQYASGPESDWVRRVATPHAALPALVVLNGLYADGSEAARAAHEEIWALVGRSPDSQTPERWQHLLDAMNRV